MLQLLPSLKNEENPKLALVLQCYVAEIIKSLVRRYIKNRVNLVRKQEFSIKNFLVIQFWFVEKSV